jgi:hypothetical protein
VIVTLEFFHTHAMILFLDAYEFNLRQGKMISRIFHDHGAKHSVLKDTFSIYLGLKPLAALKKRQLTESSYDHCMRGLAAVGEGIMSGYSNYQWWTTADSLKQECFYVDFRNGIISPSTKTKSDYDVARKIVLTVRKDVRFFIAAIKNANEKELKEFRNDFANAEMVSHVHESIKRNSKR